QELPWVGPQRTRQLTRFGLLTLGDLVSHFPKRWEDRNRFDRFPQTESDIPVCVMGMVQSAAVQRRGRARSFELRLVEEQSHALAGQITVRWFNLYWIEKVVATGMRLVVYGKPKRRGRQIVLEQPEFEVLEDDSSASLHLQRIVPIHRATEGLSTRVLRGVIWETLQRLESIALPNLIPATLDPMPRIEALRQIHFPNSFEDLSRARKHLVLNEFFGMQLSIALRRAEQQAQPGLCHAKTGQLVEQLHSSLPFSLTGAQLRTIEEIRSDMASGRPMNRLLHGDVGSGKTRLCAPLGIRVGLRTGNRKEESGPLPLFDHDRWQQAVASGSADRPAAPPSSEQPDIIVGTHALLYGKGNLDRLGLAVIDEQHKFGVLQRATLRAQGVCPDMLVMTATPIPRTLTMSLYGDLDVSTLDELPKGRGKIVTVARDSSKLPEAAKFLREHLEAGRQAYIVYPLIDASDKLEAKAAAAEFERWQGLLAPMPCALLHGRIPPEEKDAIMEQFRQGTT
ncbi:MAG: DNA helicase RecG, partial [Proteobacteria bacterium]|nr:DNA helicase RecG [Pseudomonadota bacterium]